MAKFDDMPAPEPIEAMPDRPRDEEEATDAGSPPKYRSEDETCESCEYFREFTDPPCTKFSYPATPGGSCEAFESRKEDSHGTKEDSYGSIGDEDLDGDE